MMRKQVVVKKNFVLLFAVLIFILSGCSSTALADSFDEDTVKTAAQEGVGYLIAGEYDKVVAMMNSDMQAALSAETLAENMEAMNAQTGAFKEYKSIAVAGQKDAQGTNMAVVVIVAAFEERNVTYTVSFSTDMKMCGLWMK